MKLPNDVSVLRQFLRYFLLSTDKHLRRQRANTSFSPSPPATHTSHHVDASEQGRLLRTTGILRRPHISLLHTGHTSKRVTHLANMMWAVHSWRYMMPPKQRIACAEEVSGKEYCHGIANNSAILQTRCIAGPLLERSCADGSCRATQSPTAHAFPCRCGHLACHCDDDNPIVRSWARAAQYRWPRSGGTGRRLHTYRGSDASQRSQHIV